MLYLFFFLMTKYELVLVIDANLTASVIKEVKEKSEKLVWEWILQIDDMWLMPLAYPLLWQDQAYYVSYYLEKNWEDLTELKSDLKLVKWLAKFSFFKMSDHEEFLTFSELDKKYTDLLPKEEESQESEEEIEE